MTNFKIVVTDWGSTWFGFHSGSFFGGTPVYAGPMTFGHNEKDLFSFGRLAMELFMDKSGKASKL